MSRLLLSSAREGMGEKESHKFNIKEKIIFEIKIITKNCV